MIDIFRRLKKVEKILVVFLLIITITSGFKVLQSFYLEHSDISPIKGGLYTEGMVGKLGIINPLFVRYSSVTHDITQLIFSGLTKYDPKTGEIIPDLADFTISENKREYTFKLKENAKWHDGKPITSNDIIYTYNTVINSPEFNGLILNYNDYSGIKVIQDNERTVRFLLEKPDSFFLVKTLVGILPKHLLSPIPIANLDKAEFNQYPIGSGPYRLTSVNKSGNGVEVNLEAFEDYYNGALNIPNIRLKIYEDYEVLIKNTDELDAIRNVPQDYLDQTLKKGKFSLLKYSLPQYVAVFINTQSPILSENNVRLALQLATDKATLGKSINQNEIIDTPLLEIDQKNWVYQYSINKANGALKDAGWILPNKPQEESIATKKKASKEKKAEEVKAKEYKSNEPSFITSPNEGRDWRTSDSKIVITGTAPKNTKSILVNDYVLRQFTPNNKAWSYIASLEFKNLKPGKNKYEVFAIDFNDKKQLIDSIIIYQGNESDFMAVDLAKVDAENQLANILPVRVNKKGEPLALKLTIPSRPTQYKVIAQFLKQEWKKIGINLIINQLEGKEFQEAIFKRDYDLLIFGQNLGYNLDSFPYWHSSQAKEGGYNLSLFKNFVVDSFLEKARLQYNRESRLKTLSQAQEVISKEIPAIFLYQPTYHFALSDKIQGVTLDYLANAGDRFGGIADWYANVERHLKRGTSPLTFIKWIFKQF